jgi:hypothetical protein
VPLALSAARSNPFNENFPRSGILRTSRSLPKDDRREARTLARIM